MTNKEWYRRAFSTLHASEPILLEGTNMEKTNRHFKMRPALAAGLAAALIVGCMGAAYAADLGGIQETVRMWFGGQSVEAQVEDHSTQDVGAYTFTVPGPDGQSVTRSVGGTAIAPDGARRPMSAQELAEDFATEVVETEDGAVWLYDHDKSYDITGHLADGQTRLTLEADGHTVYYDFDLEDGEILSYTRLLDSVDAPEAYLPLA